jgi:hypothetical protein
MKQNTIWGLLLIVFIVLNCYSLAHNLPAVIGGYADNFTYGLIVIEVIVVVALTYMLFKYYVPEWTKPKYTG